MKRLNLLFAVLAALFIQSCQEDTATPFELNQASDFQADVAIDWIQLERELVKTTPGFSPPVAARAYGYASLALYESVVQGIKGNRSCSGLVNGYTGQGMPVVETGKNYDWELVANACMADMLRKLFKTTSPANVAAIDLLENKYKNQSATTNSETINRSIEFGKQVAAAIYDYSRTDNQEEAYLNNFPAYTIPDVPGKWEPTAPNQKPMQPFWGSVRPFNPANVDNNLIQAFPPENYSEDTKSVFYLQANEVYITGINLTAAQTDIAKFWSDDPGLTSTPPGHSMSIAAIVLGNENENLAVAAEVFCKVGLAVHDAFVSCWKSKYVYNLLRPVTYIQKLIDPNYKTLLNTPPFPEHTSGHSVQTSAAMTVLESYYGSAYPIVDNTHAGRTDINGAPRSYSSFRELATEAAISRLYGGIHYRAAIDKGILQGVIIGRNIANVNLKN